MLSYQTPLGRLVSEIYSPYGTGSDVIEIVDGLSYDKSGPGGYQAISGTIDPVRVRNQPDLYRWGSIWRLRRVENHAIVCAGRIGDPAIGAAGALLVARGWGLLPDRQADRLCYQSMAYTDWASGDGDPYAYNFNLNSSIQCQPQGGKLVISIGNGAVLATNDQNTLVFWASGNTPSHITFTASLNRAPGAGYWLKVDTAVGPSASANERLSQQLNSGTTYTFDADLGAGDLEDLVRIRFIYTGGGATLARDLVISITGLKVDYIAPSDAFAASDMVADICGRLGISTALVQTTTQPIVPADFKSSTYRAPLDLADAFQDYRTLMRDLGAGPVCDYGPWTSRVWTAVDPEIPFDPLPLDRYNRVPVSWTYTNGASGFVKAAPVNDPLPAVSEYPQVLSLPGTYPDSTVPTAFGVVAATFLSQLRYAGRATLHSVLDPDNARHSAHDVEAGDTLILQSYGIAPRIASLHGTGSEVSVTFDERMSALDKLVAQANRAQALLGQ